MVKRWRSCLSLLVSLSCILLMLFSATLQVNAQIAPSSSSTSYSLTLTFNGGMSEYAGSSGYINNGTGSISTATSYRKEGGTYHFKVPLSIVHSTTGFSGLDEPVTYTVWLSSLSSSSGTLSNICLVNSSNQLFHVGVGSAQRGFYCKYVDIQSATDNNKIDVKYYLEFDITFPAEFVGYSNNGLYSTNLNFVCSVYCAHYGGSIAQEVSDSGVTYELQELNTSTQAIEESVTSDTGGGILATIKNFFGSFFENIINSLISVFVPEDGFFTDWFTRVNTLLSQKLGMLYAPFDLVITILNAVYSSSGTFSGIPFPEISWDGTVLVSAQTITFASVIGNDFADIQGYVYFATDVVLLWAFLVLLQRKVTLILRGNESG